MVSIDDEARAVGQINDRLAASFPDLAPEVVARTVQSCYLEFASSPIREFVPVLVERLAKAALLQGAAAT